MLAAVAIVVNDGAMVKLPLPQVVKEIGPEIKFATAHAEISTYGSPSLQEMGMNMYCMGFMRNDESSEKDSC